MRERVSALQVKPMSYQKRASEITVSGDLTVNYLIILIKNSERCLGGIFFTVPVFPVDTSTVIIYTSIGHLLYFLLHPAVVAWEGREG